MKHREFIPALTDSYLAQCLNEGYNCMTRFINEESLYGSLEEFDANLYYAQRKQLEGNTNFRQVLPYLVIRQNGKYFTFQRTSKVGELRLAGKTSIGIGGHGDITDVDVQHGQKDHSYIHAICMGAAREITEELVFIDKNLNAEVTPEVMFTLDGLVDDGNSTYVGMSIEPIESTVTIHCGLEGLIYSSADDTDKVHLGVVIVCDLPDHVDIRIKEDELVDLGFKTKQELVGLELESWSYILVNNASL